MRDTILLKSAKFRLLRTLSAKLDHDDIDGVCIVCQHLMLSVARKHCSEDESNADGWSTCSNQSRDGKEEEEPNQ
jgi:hypothetical protein